MRYMVVYKNLAAGYVVGSFDNRSEAEKHHDPDSQVVLPIVPQVALDAIAKADNIARAMRDLSPGTSEDVYKILESEWHKAHDCAIRHVAAGSGDYDEALELVIAIHNESPPE